MIEFLITAILITALFIGISMPVYYHAVFKKRPAPMKTTCGFCGVDFVARPGESIYSCPDCHYLEELYDKENPQDRKPKPLYP